MKGAIFDLDGTLLDSMGWWESFGSTYLKELGLTPTPGLDEEIKTLTLVQSANLLRDRFGVTASVPEILEDIDRRAEVFYREQVLLKKGAFSLLKALHTHGVKLCVATASDRGPALAALERNGVLQLFEAILTCTEEGVGKDRPDIYETAARRLVLPKEEVFVFEDALHAIQTAKKAGFVVVGVYDAGFLKEQEEIQRTADFYINMEEEGLFEQYFDHCRV